MTDDPRDETSTADGAPDDGAPVDGETVNDTPTTDEAGTDSAPGNDEPGTDSAPGNDEPGTDDPPSNDEPTVPDDGPLIDEPAPDADASDAATTDVAEASADEPVADEPVADEPEADEPVADEPVADDPEASVEAPVADEPEPEASVDEPEPVVDDAVADDPADDDEADADATSDGSLADELDEELVVAAVAAETGKAAKAPKAPKPLREAKPHGALKRLYHGETNYDFIGRTKLWFAVSGAIVLVGLLSLGVRGLNLGIDFEGGAVYEVPTQDLSVADARDALETLDEGGAKVQETEGISGRFIKVQTETLDTEKSLEVQRVLAEAAGVDVQEVNRNEVGPSWGQEISKKALRALIVFLIVISLYITVRFEFKMAIPTLIAMLHDVLVTIGIYSITGLEVTPATVIAVLTILGFSIYDGIVVFDKVNENTRLASVSGRMTYGDVVNLSLNETLMRSLNTSITALIPIAALLGIGSQLLGAKTLEEFGLALLIGLASGAYSSLFIASPLLAVLKEREPRYLDIRRRLAVRDERIDRAGGTGAADGELAGVGAAGGAPRPAGPRPEIRTGAVIPPRPRKKGKRR